MNRWAAGLETSRVLLVVGLLCVGCGSSSEGAPPAVGQGAGGVGGGGAAGAGGTGGGACDSLGAEIRSAADKDPALDASQRVHPCAAPTPTYDNACKELKQCLCSADPVDNEGCCEHWSCQTGVALTAACAPCVTTVCAQDASCCSVEWSASCVALAKQSCSDHSQLNCGP